MGFTFQKMLLVVDIAVHFAKNLSNEEVNAGFVWEKTDVAWMNPGTLTRHHWTYKALSLETCWSPPKGPATWQWAIQKLLVCRISIAIPVGLSLGALPQGSSEPGAWDKADFTSKNGSRWLKKWRSKQQIGFSLWRWTKSQYLLLRK